LIHVVLNMVAAREVRSKRTSNDKSNRRSFDYGGKSAAFAQDETLHLLG